MKHIPLNIGSFMTHSRPFFCVDNNFSIKNEKKERKKSFLHIPFDKIVFFLSTFDKVNQYHIPKVGGQHWTGGWDMIFSPPTPVNIDHRNEKVGLHLFAAPK